MRINFFKNFSAAVRTKTHKTSGKNEVLNLYPFFFEKNLAQLKKKIAHHDSTDEVG